MRQHGSKLRRWLLGGFASFAVAALPTSAFAQTLLGANGQRFDIDSSSGAMSDGTSDSYDTCYTLTVGGSTFFGSSSTLTLSGRQVEIGPESLAGLQVSRRIYVPSTGTVDWARYVEVLDNGSGSEIATTVTISGNLGSDSSTIVTSSSSGDSSVSTADGWFATDDGGGGDPSLAHVVQALPGTGALVEASAISISDDDNVSYTFDVTVPAGGRVLIMTFAIQATTSTATETEATRLADAPDDALFGLDDDLVDIVNWSVGTVVTDCTGIRAGMPCDDGLYCTRRDRCDGAGACVGAGDPCNDGSACTVDTCFEATDSCTNVTESNRCVIGGECIANGYVHPAYPCLVCDPARDASDWSPLDEGTVCGAAECAGGLIVPEATCSSTGQCLRAASVRCAVGYCADAVSCVSECTAGECPGDSFCAPSGACELRRANGSSCAADVDCTSDSCVDGICCDTGCTGSCMSCVVPGFAGTCTAVPAGSDPDGECGQGGYCTGAGECSVPAVDAGPPVPDAGPRPDAGALPDAGMTTFDASTEGPSERAGCTISAGMASSHGTVWSVWAFGALALWLARRRR